MRSWNFKTPYFNNNNNNNDNKHPLANKCPQDLKRFFLNFAVVPINAPPPPKKKQNAK